MSFPSRNLAIRAPGSYFDLFFLEEAGGMFTDEYQRQHEGLRAKAKKLGLETLFVDNLPQTAHARMVQIETQMVAWSQKLADHTFFSYTREEVLASINFLELFLMCAAAKDSNVRNTDDIDSIRKHYAKAMKALEDFRDTCEKPITAALSPSVVKHVIDKIERVFNEDLGLVEKMALRPLVSKAEKALTEYKP